MVINKKYKANSSKYVYYLRSQSYGLKMPSGDKVDVLTR